MALVLLDSILIKNNPAMFADSLTFEITFTSLAPLPLPLQWKIIYVGSALSEKHDQILQEFQIGPFQDPATMKFQIQCKAPDPTLIPRNELLCVTAIILTVSYNDSEFIRVGYYVHNQFLSEDPTEQSNYPLPIIVATTKRTIIADKPRITNFTIEWLNTNKQNKPKVSKQEAIDKLSTQSHSYYELQE